MHITTARGSITIRKEGAESSDASGDKAEVRLPHFSIVGR
jgi:hypothetical protein